MVILTDLFVIAVILSVFLSFMNIMNEYFYSPAIDVSLISFQENA